jgi:hypothetical protein
MEIQPKATPFIVLVKALKVINTSSHKMVPDKALAAACSELFRLVLLKVVPHGLAAEERDAFRYAYDESDDLP